MFPKGRDFYFTFPIRTLNLEAEQKFLDDKGILHALRGRDDLEEAAGVIYPEKAFC
jgi:hypothetical protein